MIQSLQAPLTFLIYSTAIMLIITGVFFIKLMIDISSLSKSLYGLSTIVKHELEPTLKEFKKALTNINTLTSSDDLNKTINKGFSAISNSALNMAGKMNILAKCAKQGILAGIKVFSKK